MEIEDNPIREDNTIPTPLNIFHAHDYVEKQIKKYYLAKMGKPIPDELRYIKNVGQTGQNWIENSSKS